VVLVAFVILTAQLWRLQIVEGPALRQRAENNRVRVSPITPQRGVIYDRNGTLLAANAPMFVVSIVPADLPSRGELAVYSRLGALLAIPQADIKKAVDKRVADGDIFTPVQIKTNVPRDAALMVEQQHSDLAGVVVTVESSRRYAEGPLLAHIIGYTGPISPALLTPEGYRQKIDKEGYTINDRIGTAGLEDSYEHVLRGRPGRRMYEVEASGRELTELRVEAPDPGKNITLSIDVGLQRAVTTMLREGLKNGNVGVAIVSDVRTGEVLSMVSLPTFDNNLFNDSTREEELSRSLKDPEQPFFHRAIAGNYPPGSTFKLVTALGALTEGVATRDTTIESKGILWVPHDFYPSFRQPFPDWAPLGRLNLAQAIGNSSNIYFFYLGGGYEPERFAGLGNERLARHARNLGFGGPTGIDVAGESSGTIPDEAWKVQRVGERWVKGDTYNMSIGQGYVESTPIQVQNMTVAIANGGNLLRPRVVRQLTDSDGNVVQAFGPSMIRSLELDPRHLRNVVEGMELGFSGQLLRDYRIPGLRVAGKTGTAEFGQAVNAQGELPTHGWFTGFAPVDNPRYAVTVFVERGASSRDAAPIAARILRHLFGIPQELKPPPLPGPPPAVAPATAARPAPVVQGVGQMRPISGAAATPGPASGTGQPKPIVQPARPMSTQVPQFIPNTGLEAAPQRAQPKPGG
jgi:penicillin-binding protein 2